MHLLPYVAGLGPAELLIIVAIGVPFVISLWGLFDALPRPGDEWTRAGQNRTLWITLLVVSLPASCFTLGVIVPILYFLIPRPALSRARRGGRSTD